MCLDVTLMPTLPVFFKINVRKWRILEAAHLLCPLANTALRLAAANFACAIDLSKSVI
jgi:hypothetical protein